MTIAGLNLKTIAGALREVTIGPVPAGAEAFLLADLARAEGPLAYILSDGQRLADLEQMLGFAAPTFRC